MPAPKAPPAKNPYVTAVGQQAARKRVNEMIKSMVLSKVENPPMPTTGEALSEISNFPIETQRAAKTIRENTKPSALPGLSTSNVQVTNEFKVPKRVGKMARSIEVDGMESKISAALRRAAEASKKVSPMTSFLKKIGLGAGVAGVGMDLASRMSPVYADDGTAQPFNPLRGSAVDDLSTVGGIAGLAGVSLPGIAAGAALPLAAGYLANKDISRDTSNIPGSNTLAGNIFSVLSRRGIADKLK